MDLSQLDFQHIFLGLLQQPVLLFVAILVATFILEDPATIATGVLLAKGLVSWPFALTALAVGIFLGDVGLYGLGRGVRAGFFRQRSWSYRPTKFDLVLARFVPGLRTLTFGAAGFFRFPLGHFLLITFPSTIVWTGLLLAGTDQLVREFRFVPWWGWAILGLALMALGHWVKAKFTPSRGGDRPSTPA
jgi:membrane protein DedA with SNARE-associated domain